MKCMSCKSPAEWYVKAPDPKILMVSCHNCAWALLSKELISLDKIKPLKRKPK